jgi:hypothetical protein
VTLDKNTTWRPAKEEAAAATRVLSGLGEKNTSAVSHKLSAEKYGNLKSQFVISSWGGSRRAAPYAFTELGVAMLSSVLNSKRAVQMNILIMRVFVKLRDLTSTHKALADKIEKLEQTQKQHSTALVGLIQDVQRLKTPPQTRAMGFFVGPGSKKK